MSILLVDDHLDTVKAMSHLLKKYGSIKTATSIASALATARAEHFDLVISDLGLPDGSGHDLMRQLKRESEIKGIAVSGFGMDQDIESSLRAGFSEHLTKPVDIRRLEAALAKLMTTDKTPSPAAS